MQQAADEHAALHIMCTILSPASYSDFRARIHELFEAGEVQGALAFWVYCVEIQHFPRAPHRESEYPGLPPVRVRPCTQLPRARCDGRRGGFQFPFIGVHCPASVLVEPGTDPSRAWARYHGLQPASLEPRWQKHGPVLPIHADRMLQLATTRNVWWAWRAWHAGRYEWREPALQPRVVSVMNVAQSPIIVAGLA